jgi:predicted amidohydrolase
MQGAKLILISAQWPVTRIEHWDLLLRARAIENQVIVVGCNRIGSNEEYNFSGHSTNIAPDGNRILKADDSENVWQADIQLEDVFHYRKSLPFLYDIRNELI